MSRRRTARTAVALIVTCCSLAAVASAGAAAWHGPLQISDAQVNVGETTPRISLGAGGDAGAGWWDEAGGGRVVLARKLRGAAWSAPVGVVLTGTAAPVCVGVDSQGDVTAAYSLPGPVAQVATWGASAAAPTVASLAVPGGLEVTDLAVNALGDAVVAGLAGLPAQVYVGYRRGFDGTFELHPFPSGTATSARVAINAQGVAAVVFRAGSQLFGATRARIVDWPLSADRVSGPGETVPVGDPSVGIDAAGTAVAAFTIAGPATVVRTSLRAPGGVWQESPDLSSPAAGFTAADVTVAVDPAGAALLAWDERNTVGYAAILALAGSTGSGHWGTIETASEAGADPPVAAIGNDGTAVVAWEHDTGAGTVGQARVRAPGDAGAWGEIRELGSLAAPSLSTDGSGDFATIGAPSGAPSYKPAVISFFDAAPPAISPVVFAGTNLAGTSVSMTVATQDSWSAIGTPTWTFGDGGSASGLSVAHLYTTNGPYDGHVSVTDDSGNKATADFTVVVGGTAPVTLAGVGFSARWKRSRVTGTVQIEGAVPRDGTYTLSVTRGRTQRIHSSFSLAAGPFSRTLELPATLLPGVYAVVLAPSAQLHERAHGLSPRQACGARRGRRRQGVPERRAHGRCEPEADRRRHRLGELPLRRPAEGQARADLVPHRRR